jgi:hypothetical protein
MTVKELKEYLEAFEDDAPVIVTFHWKGETVVDDIYDISVNGPAVQLNTDTFVEHILKQQEEEQS